MKPHWKAERRRCLGLPRLGLCRGSVLGQRAGARAGETRVNGFDSRQGKSNVQTRILSPALISPADGPRACFSLWPKPHLIPQEAPCKPRFCSNGYNSKVTAASGVPGSCLVYSQTTSPFVCKWVAWFIFHKQRGWTEGEKIQRLGLAFHFVATAKEKLFSSFWHPSEKGPGLWNKKLSTAGSHHPGSGSPQTHKGGPGTDVSPDGKVENIKETYDWSAGSSQPSASGLRRKLPEEGQQRNRGRGSPASAVCQSEM